LLSLCEAKETMMKKLFLLALLLLFGNPLYAEQLRNDAALAGLSEAKVIFDINVGDPDLLLLRLKFVDKTYQQLREFGVEPKFVLAFRGKASRYVTSGEDYLHPDDLAQKRQVEDWIKAFSKSAMTLEQCAMAASLQKIANEDFLPEIKVVANGYISMIGYQNKGYAFVPMD
jgi:intracellular sulfur oxidation DsrE/DsrF family protein